MFDNAISRLCRDLQLQPHLEGGFYREMFRSPDAAERPAFSSILLLLPSGQVSRLHRLDAAMLWNFHGGVALRIWELMPAGPRPTLLGSRGAHGETLQHAVAPGVWFGAEVAGPAGYGLAGCVVAPAFTSSGMEFGSREVLSAEFPEAQDVIERLTPVE